MAMTRDEYEKKWDDEYAKKGDDMFTKTFAKQDQKDWEEMVRAESEGSAKEKSNKK